MTESSSAIERPAGHRASIERKAGHFTAAVRASWPAVAWMLGLLAYRDAAEARLSAVSGALWGLLVLTAFVAWGATVTRTLSKRLGWGFDGATGMALTMAVLGALASVRLISVPLIVIWCAAGPIALSFARWFHFRSSGWTAEWSPSTLAATLTAKLLKPRPFSFIAGLVVLSLMAALQYVESVANAGFNQWDDDEAYRQFAREFLDTGTLYGPFSWRRAASYGGQSLLHAIVLALSDRERIHILDDGICVLLLLGIIACFRTRPRWGSRGAVLAAGFFLLTLPSRPHNTGSEFSGALFFLALFALFDDPGFANAPLRSNAILTGLLAAAACTLRQTYVSAVVAFVGFMYLQLLVFPPQGKRTAWLARGAAGIGATATCLLPWLAMAYRAEHTFLYPLFKGNVRPDFGVVGKVEHAELLRWCLQNLFTLWPVTTMALMFAAAFTLPVSRRTQAVHVFLLASTISFMLMIYFFQAFNQADSIARYYFAFTFAFAIAVTLRSLGEASTSRRPGAFFIAASLVVVAIAVQFLNIKNDLLARYIERIDALENVIKNQRGKPGADRGGVAREISEGDQARLSDTYRRLQETVPAGEPILVVLDHTYLLDGKRNQVYVYDHPGATGPHGGPPCFQGSEAFARYLRSVGVRYIAYQWGDSSPEYFTSLWTSRRAASDPTNGRGGFYKNQARFELDFLDSVTSLAASRAVRFAEGEFKVLDLDKPSGG